MFPKKSYPFFPCKNLKWQIYGDPIPFLKEEFQVTLQKVTFHWLDELGIG